MTAQTEFRAQRFQAAAYPHWLHDAEHPPACRDEPIATFFPNGNQGSTVARARAICRSCPLRIRCRNWALTQPTADLHGIWGGTTQHEREQLLATRRTRP